VNEKIQALAEEAGFERMDMLWHADELERFAELVRQDEANGMRETYMKMIHGAIADEREKCARLCDDLAEGLVGDDFDGAWGAGHCARAIEARGEK